MAGQIDVFNPYAPTIEEHGLETVLAQTDRFAMPFLHVLGARWYAAQKADGSGMTRTVSQPAQSAAEVLLTVDHLLPSLLHRWGGIEAVRRSYRKVIVSSCLPALGEWYTSIAMNGFLSARSGPVTSGTGFSYEGFGNDLERPIPLVPMGCAQGWLPQVDHADRVIFLDEPHGSLLELLGKAEEDVRVVLFRHALETCRRLSRKGFRIVSFARENSDAARALYAQHDFIEIIDVGGWIPFTELAAHYAKASLFFSFFTETHGYSIYENLQIGNGVVTYAETFDAYRLMPMQRGVLLSIYTSPDLSAALVEEYFERFAAKRLRAGIRATAHEQFSTETYFRRLLASKSFQALKDDRR